MANYDELLAFDNKLKTHQRHLHFLTIERYESKNKPKPRKEKEYFLSIANVNTQRNME